MPKNWKTYKLSDALEIKYGKDHKKVEDGNIPIYGTGGVMRFGNQFLYNDESILIPRKGSLNNIYYINEAFWTVDTLFWSIINKEIAFPKYLFYNLKILDFANMDVGSAVPSLTTSLLKEIEIKLPPLPEQKAIANILSAIDDKIENNLAINKTLEDMAMALYKHWFVDFGPFQEGNFVDSELGLIPEGWEVKRLVEFCTLTMGQSPKSEFYNNNKEGLPFHQGVKDYGERFPSDETYSTNGKRFALKGDVLFSVRAPVGRLNIAKNKIILGRGLASIRINNFNHFGFLFYALNTRFTEDDIIGDGTVYKSVNKSDLQNLKFLIPPNQLINDFNHKVKPNDEKYLNNFKENQSLSRLRDTLLPKLISGEIRLKEFQNQIETVL
jgi:type I restriction enzyme S subunit